MMQGELIAGRYRLVSLVGRGAMGIVWSARDERGGRTVAVKQLLEDTTAREARIAGRLHHPNAIAVFEVVTHDGKQCVVMEYLPAKSLRTLGVLPPEQVARIGSQIAGALAEAHAIGIVHRDVKPDNILIAEDGTAKITDFGISRAIGDGTLTATTMIAGTPAYLAPEVAEGEQADYRSDVFSFGATLYAALDGEPPFGLEDNPIAMLRRVAGGEIRPPQQAGPLTGLLLLLLRRDPAERPTMHEAHEALTAAANGQPLPTFRPHTPTVALPARRVSRRAVVAGAVGAGLVAIGVLLGTVLDGATSSTNNSASGNNNAGGGPGPAGTTTTSPPADRSCAASYRVTQTWPGGYQAEVTVRNTGTETLNGWKLRWTLPSGHQIQALWNGALAADGTAVTVTNASYNVTIAAAASVTVGFNVNGDSTVYGTGRPAPPVRCESG